MQYPQLWVIIYYNSLILSALYTLDVYPLKSEALCEHEQQSSIISIDSVVTQPIESFFYRGNGISSLLLNFTLNTTVVLKYLLKACWILKKSRIKAHSIYKLHTMD